MAMGKFWGWPSSTWNRDKPMLLVSGGSMKLSRENSTRGRSLHTRSATLASWPRPQLAASTHVVPSNKKNPGLHRVHWVFENP